MTDKPAGKAEPPAEDVPEAEGAIEPGSPGWQPGRPEKRSDRTSGPTCPYRGF
jgi:hypothetical protein